VADPMGGTAPPRGVEPTEVHLVRLHRDDRRPLMGAIVVVAALVLAVLKPWGGPDDASRAVESGALSAGAAGVAVASTDPAATPAATPRGYDAPGGQCYPGADWRLFAIEMNSGRRLRHWLTIEPAAAASPDDPAVPFARIVTDRLLALGFCVGSGRAGPGPLVGVRAWALAAGGGVVPISLTPLADYMPREPNLGAVYRPPSAPRGAAGAEWSPGRYVFSVRQGPTEADERWFGVEVVVAPQVPAVGAPSAAP
jgi:hypothetical protein